MKPSAPRPTDPAADSSDADRPGMFCRKCGYNLLNLPERRPECGQAFNPGDARTFALYSRPRFLASGCTCRSSA